MTSEQRKRAYDVFQAALRQDPAVRSIFLDGACGDDLSLRKEVESLLEAHDKAAVEPTGRGPRSWGSQGSEDVDTTIKAPLRQVSHYVIVRMLGEGGMGQVYLAEDTKLRRQVALKALSESLTQNEERKQRFIQEARAAAAIEHPNIAAVHDIVESDGRTFIVMEYVRGKTLREAIRGGELDVSTAIHLGIQVAEGLSKAHDRGVVHRDLKPDNVLISEEGYAKIIDFGLAKLFGHLSPDPDEQESAIETATSLKTRAGMVMGTAAYMSPEQARGEHVDARSDVFSFGAVFYEMLTGEGAFKRPSASESVSAVLRDVTPPLRLQSGPRSDLNRVLSRALAKKAEDRYQNIKDLVSDLRTVQHRARRTRLPRPVIAAAAALLVVIVVAAGWLGGRLLRPAPPAAPNPVSVLIADFENGTGDPVFDSALEQAVEIAIEGASFINSYRRGQARADAETIRPGAKALDGEMARLVSQRHGIDAIVTGAIDGDDGDYRVAMEAIDTRTGEILVTARTDVGQKDLVLTAVGELVRRVRRALGDVAPEAQRSGGQETFTTGSLEAASAYGRAQELMVVGECQQAMPLYRRAIDLDPDFGRAYAGLAACSYNLGQVAEARQGYEAAMARIDRMTEREKLRTRGGYYLMVRNYEKAAEEYQALNDAFPYDPAGLSNLPLAYFYERDMGRTLAAARRVVEVYPENTLSRGNLALFAMYAGDFPTASKEAGNVLESNPSYETAYVALAMAALAEEDLELARRTYRRLESISTFGKSLATTGLADIALYAGRTAEARELLDKGVASDESSGYTDEAARKRLWLARLQLGAGKSADAVALAARSLAASQREHLQYLAAEVFLDAGEPARALELAERLGERFQPEPRTYAKLIEGHAHLRSGDVQSATVSYRAALRVLDTWLGRFHLGRAWVEAGAFTEAYSELEACLKRRGEATAVFLDDVPSYHLLPPVYYYLGRAQEGLGSPAAADSYRAFVNIKGTDGSTDPLVADARRRLASLR